MGHLTRSIILVALLTLCLQGCNTTQSIALNTTASILADATQEVETETSWDIFKDSVPAALKTLEGFLYLDSTNEDLLVSLTKGYGSYGFAVYETLHLKESLSDSDKTPMKDLAITHYDRSIQYGLRWLKTHDVVFSDLANQIKQNKSIEYLDGHLDGEDKKHIEGVFFLGQSWMSYINLQRDKPAALAQLYIVKGLFDWACKKEPDFRFGACQVFYGAYETSRPKMFGGNPKKGVKIFRDAIQKHPNNLFLRVAFLQYYAIPASDEAEYKKQVKLIQNHKALNTLRIPGQSPISLESKKQTGQIYNSIALRRFQIIRQYETDLF